MAKYSRETPDLASYLSRSLADRLHSAAIRLLRHARRDDEQSGLSAARLSALSVLVFAGSRTVSELAAIEQVAVPTMTKLLQGLERDGFVRRSRDRDDGRVVHVHARAQGRRALESARARRVQHVQTLVASMNAAEAEILGRALSALERALGEAQPS